MKSIDLSMIRDAGRPSILQLGFRLILAILVTLSCALLVQAQTETGQITGQVFDPSDALIPNAAITAVDISTKGSRTTTANNGVFVFANMSSGRYEVTASAPGFQSTKQIVTLTVGARLGLDFHLKVGAASETVVVQEVATPVNVETQTIGATISTEEVLNLPTLTRNPYDLVKTVGNTTDSDPSARGVGVSINGLRSADVGIMLDGVPNNNNFDTTVAIQTPLDSVGEVAVLTNNFTAEFGRALAGVVNVETKRGANAFHGNAYEFNRASALASNTFDNNANAIEKPVFVRNQFGFSVGGPIKKDKAFFFANPEWIRVRSQATQTASIVTSELLNASDINTRNFFSTYAKLKPGLIPLQVFRRGDVCSPSTTTGACATLDPAMPLYQKVAYNVPADSGGGSPQNTIMLAARVDYIVSDKTQMYVRYALQKQDYFAGTVTNSPYIGYDTGQTNTNNGVAFSLTHVLSPTMTSQTKLSYNRITNVQPLSTAPIGPTLYTTLGATSSLGNASIVYPGYSPFTPGNAIPFGGPQNFVQFNHDMTKLFGQHNLRFGGLYTYLQDNRAFGAYQEAVQALGTNRDTALNGLVTGQAHDFQAAIYPQGKYPCIAGVVTPDCTLTLPVGPPQFDRSNAVHEAALYIQDSWKLAAHFTLNFGIRWEYFGPQASRKESLDSNFFFGPGANLQIQSGTGRVYQSTDAANPLGGLWQKDWNNFAPRIGFAWDMFGNGKTSLRGGYGIGYTPNFGNVTFNVIQNPPNYGVIALTAGTDVPTIPITTNNAGPLAGSSVTKALGRVTLRAVDPYITTAYAHLWSVAFEHQFARDVVGAIEYTGSKGVNLYTINRLNIPGSKLLYANTGSATTRINDQYSYINFRTNNGFSNYHGMNLRLDLNNFRQKGLSMRVNYTWSHAIDNMSNTFSEQVTGVGNLGLLDPMNPKLDKGSAEFDVRHRFSLAGMWDVPFKSQNKVANIFLGGWSLIPNITARTGTPFTVYDSTNEYYAIAPRVMFSKPFRPVYTQTQSGSPNEFNYMTLTNVDSSYVNPVVGVADFGPFPGNMTSRNAFRAPGVWNVDFSIHKNIAITEGVRLQFRAEMYNMFNHSNLYVVWSNTDAWATSTITATKGVRADNLTTIENRNVQLALKLIF